VFVRARARGAWGDWLGPDAESISATRVRFRIQLTLLVGEQSDQHEARYLPHRVAAAVNRLGANAVASDHRLGATVAGTTGGRSGVGWLVVAQYSAASMIVITRSVTAGSAGSGE
jgi:hypothetical protein